MGYEDNDQSALTPAGEQSSARSNSGNAHIAGEMFVAAELAKRGYAVSLTMGNTKAIDLFAEKDGRALCIQVKAIRSRKSSGWPVPVQENKIKSHVIYVCVILNEVGTSPSYYIIPPEEVIRRRSRYENRATLQIGKLRDGGFEEAWHIIEEQFVTDRTI